MVNTKVTLSGLELDNPVIPASGTFGFGYEFADLYDIDCLGSIALKGTTREPRFGNPTPRIAECTEGLINSVGLQNPGVDKVISEELPKLAKVFHKPAVANISGFSVEDYVVACEKLDKEDQIGLLEVNISCPNVHNGGMSFGTDPNSAAEVTKAVKAVTTKPVYMKLSPNVTDIAEIACACKEAGADGISLINTLMGMRISLKTQRPVIANKMGGFPAPPSSRSRCAWSGRSMRPPDCPSSAWAASRARKTCWNSCWPVPRRSKSARRTSSIRWLRKRSSKPCRRPWRNTGSQALRIS